MDLLVFSKRFHLQQLSTREKQEALHQDVLQGLFKYPYCLPPKYFYDELGSRLFDEICKTHDYYPTRTELALLRTHADEIVNLVNPNTCVELGAGTSAKTEILLSYISSNKGEQKFNYVSIDVCKEVLEESAQRLLHRYKNLSIQSVVGEYHPAIKFLTDLAHPTLFAFIGSSIGNFTEQEAIELLSVVADKMSLNDHFLIGMDRVKDKNVLEKAYDDDDGVTAKFNLNLLTVLNNNLGANFNLQNFSHQAVYNETEQQIEMYLVSRCEQEVYFDDLDKSVKFEKNQKILTEISRKYTKTSIKQLLNNAGLEEVKHFEPENEYFSLVLVKRKA